MCFDLLTMGVLTQYILSHEVNLSTKLQMLGLSILESWVMISAIVYHWRTVHFYPLCICQIIWPVKVKYVST